MSTRRNARLDARARPSAQLDPTTFPAELMQGPCIEDWTGWDGTSDQPDGARLPWLEALQRWHIAVDQWATQSGWAVDGRPARQACDLARSSTPWSRTFLLGHGDNAYVAWLDGQLDEFPGRRGGSGP